MDTQKTLQKENQLDVLKKHKEQLEDAKYRIEHAPKHKDIDADKNANKVKSLDEEIEKVDAQIAAIKK